MADYAPVNGGDLGEAFTYLAGAPITGGQVLVFSAPDTVSPAGAAATHTAGVAGHDAATGAPVTVHTGAGIIHETQTTVAAVAAGALLQTAVGGLVAGAAVAGAEIGVAVRSVTGAGGILRWKSTRS